MSKEAKIRIEIHVPGQGNQSHEFEYCELWEAPTRCRIDGPPCTYGLTEIDVPGCCPLRNGTVEIKVRRLPPEEVE